MSDFSLIDVSPTELYRLAGALDDLAGELGRDLTTSYRAVTSPAGTAQPSAVTTALDAVLVAADRALSATAGACSSTAARIRAAATAYEAADGRRAW